MRAISKAQKKLKQGNGGKSRKRKRGHLKALESNLHGQRGSAAVKY